MKKIDFEECITQQTDKPAKSHKTGIEKFMARQLAETEQSYANAERGRKTYNVSDQTALLLDCFRLYWQIDENYKKYIDAVYNEPIASEGKTEEFEAAASQLLELIKKEAGETIAFNLSEWDKNNI